MKKMFSLLKAVMSQDMNIFKYDIKANSSKLKKILFPLTLSFIVMFAIGSIYQPFAEGLSKVGLTYVLLTMMFFMTITLTFFECIYKSQNILFESKDNDLLLSLPIKKSNILFVRIIKLLVFQYLYNLLFTIPIFVLFIYYDRPGILFYIISVIFTILMPLIPTALGVVFGYFVKKISYKFKSKKVLSTLITLVVFTAIFLASFKLNDLITNMIAKATSINEIITKIYYPLGLYIDLIYKFDFIKFILLIVISIVPMLVAIYVSSFSYFKIINKEKETYVKKNNKKLVYKKRNCISGLVIKDLKKFISTPVYMFNTCFSLLLLLIIVIYASINLESMLNNLVLEDGINIDLDFIKNIIPYAYIQVLVFVSMLTSITSSSISIEGKKFAILKSLPIKEESILISKILFSLVITMPVVIVSNLIVFYSFKMSVLNIILIIISSILMPLISASLGLLINLKYPKMYASNDTEVIKQSTSSMVSVFAGMFISGVSVGTFVNFIENVQIFILIELGFYVIMFIVLCIILRVYGKKRIREIIV